MSVILAIDDKEDNLITISALLKHFIPKCRVIKALSGEEGIKQARIERPDVILLDYKMPGLDGFEVCKILKKDPVTSFIPIILVTAVNSDSKLRTNALEIGADAFLSKPIEGAELAAQVKAMLRIKYAEDRLRREKDHISGLYQLLFNGSASPIIVCDRIGQVVMINDAGVTKFEKTREKIIGSSIVSLLPGIHEEVPVRLEKAFKEGKTLFYEDAMQVKGETRWFWNSFHVLPGSDMHSGLVQIISSDITERKTTEQHLHKSLREKEVLIKEIHHRVKNNLQNISSLINIKKMSITNAETIDILSETAERIYSIGLVHEMLYTSENLSSINFHDYITKISGYVARLYRNDNGEVTISVNETPLQIDINRAVPLALMLNELVVNAFKYAFTKDKEGAIVINCTQDNGTYTLKVTDNGVGLPDDYDRKNTFGMVLIKQLAKQLSGSCSFSSSGGTVFELVFPV